MPVQTPIPVADRVHGFTYAIRNIVAEARKVEACRQEGPVPEHRRPDSVRVPAAAGRRGGAAARRCATAHNGYVPSPGIPEAREAVAQDWTRRGFPAHPDRVLITAGTSEGIELALTALVNPGDAVLVPSPTYPLYTAVLAKIGAVARVLPDRSRQRLAAGPRAPRAPDHAADARAGRHRSEQPDGRGLSGAHAAGADRPRRAARPGDPRRRGLRRSRLRRAGAAARQPRAGRGRSSRSRACRRRISRQAGARAGWSSGRNPRLDDLLAAHQEARRRAAVQQRADRSTRSRRRCSAIARTRTACARRSASARS